MNDALAKAAEADGKQRLARAIARAGLCSRRDAEQRILEGRVTVNGRRVESPALDVTDADIVTVDGVALPPPAPARLWRYHKPRGLITTAKDEKNRRTVFDALPRQLPRVISVGRLDLNSEGLLLLTNDGELARRLELPANGWQRCYRVRVHGRVDPARLETLADGVRIDGELFAPATATLERQQGDNAWLRVTLREGRNREVRRLLEHLGYMVNRLIRTDFGPFRLQELPRGAVAEVPQAELRGLLGLHRREAWAKPKPRRPAPGRRRKPPGGEKT